MNLILWRHAEAEDAHHNAHDHERELTAKGRKQANKIAAWLKPQLPNDLRIIVSPATRTIQTAKALNRKFEVSELVSTNGSINDHLAAARWPGDNGVLIIGHQPTLGQIAALLTSGRPDYWDIEKGAVWWLRSASKNTNDYATLKVTKAPEELE